MLLVNNAALDAAAPAQIVHAPFGAPPRIADMVFPWFLLAVGVAVPFAAGGKREQGMSRWQRSWGVLRRTAGLYAAGCLVDSSIYHRPTWGLGVLQLIALAYLVGRLLYGLPAVLRVGTAAALLLFYGWALTGLRAAGFVPGPFTEGHNFAHHLNERHLKAFSLDGLPSVVPAGALVLIGTLAGEVLRRRGGSPAENLVRLLLLAGVLGAAGKLWAGHLLMNKPFWTPSYICWSAGAGVLLLAALYLLVDVAGRHRAGAPLRWMAWPLVVYGANALVAYAGAILVKVHILQEWTWPVGKTTLTLQELAQHHLYERYGRLNGGWAYTLCYLGVVWLFCAYFYRKRVFIRA